MGTGVFALPCPACGRKVHHLDAATVVCPSCRQRYMHRLGHLVAVPSGAEQPPAEIDLRTRSVSSVPERDPRMPAGVAEERR
jgi:hypothetical protein